MHTDRAIIRRQAGRPLALPQHGCRVEPRCAPCWHPRRQHTYRNQDSGRAQERHQIARLHLEEQRRDEPCGPPAASQAERQSRHDQDANATEDEAYDAGRLRAIRQSLWITVFAFPFQVVSIPLFLWLASGTRP